MLNFGLSCDMQFCRSVNQIDWNINIPTVGQFFVTLEFPPKLPEGIVMNDQRKIDVKARDFQGNTK